jgi:hypothetical protein
MEHGTVEWNGGMVEWWNGGMVEWWNGGMIDYAATNDPVQYPLILM